VRVSPDKINKFSKRVDDGDEGGEEVGVGNREAAPGRQCCLLTILYASDTYGRNSCMSQLRTALSPWSWYKPPTNA
jgi:hypothetical protein